MKRSKFSFLTVCIIGLLAISCGGSDSKDKKEPEAGAAKEATSKEPASAGNESECVATTAISFGTEKINAEGFKLMYAGAELWQMQSGDEKYPSLNIQIANYEKSGSYLASPVEGQMRAIFSVNGKKGERITPGIYDMTVAGFGAGNNASGGIENKDGSQGFVNGSGQITITFISKDKVCGTVDLKGSGNTFIKGSFSCPVISKE